MTGKKEAHLAMIQGVVSRLGQNSFLLKGWSVLLVSALLALGTASSEELVLMVAFLPVLVFWGLDGYFLWQERLFRRLYDHVREQDEANVDYSMDVGVIRKTVLSPTWPRATFSRTLITFHLVVLVAVLVIYMIVTAG